MSSAAAGKRELLAAFADPETVFTAFNIRNLCVSALGRDAAIASAEATIRDTPQAATFEEHIHYSDPFVRREGDVRVLHIQVTPLATP